MEQPHTTRCLATRLAALCIAVAAFCLTGTAAQTDVEANSWTDEDTRGSAYFSATPEGYVAVSFAAVTGLPYPSVGTLVAGATGNGAAFTGDYREADVVSVAFRLRSETTVQRPVQVKLQFEGATSGRIWANGGVTVSGQAGLWVTNTISLDFADGWRRDGVTDTAELFEEDIRDVGMIGLRISQADTAAKLYAIDAFVLLDTNGESTGPFGLLPARLWQYFAAKYGVTDASQITDEMKNADTDGDGMSDWNELMAGTNPEDPNSIFAVEVVTDDTETTGITIRWPCVVDGKYTVLRSTDLVQGLAPFVFGLAPSAQEAQDGFMSYTDATATGAGPYFFKVVKE